MDKAEEAINLIIEASKKLDPNQPWEIGYSGGKDSTTVLNLLIEAIKQGAIINKLYVIYTDTLLEHPVLRREALEALESLRQYPNITPVRLTPKPGEDFISMMVKKGYPVPGPRFRWCMARLKIRPMMEFMRRLGHFVQVSGIRASESSDRGRRYGGLDKFVNGANPILMPILDWTTEDVINYLREARRWDGRDFGYLLSLYEVGGYALFTSVRFGCWVCTVVRNDRMPVPPILKWARERLIAISRDPSMRIIIDGKPRGLSEVGRREVARVFLRVLEEYPEAFGYNVGELRGMLGGVVGISVE